MVTIERCALIAKISYSKAYNLIKEWIFKKTQTKQNRLSITRKHCNNLKRDKIRKHIFNPGYINDMLSKQSLHKMIGHSLK